MEILKLDENNFETIKSFAIIRLTQIFLLSEKIEKYISDDEENLKNNLKQYKDSPFYKLPNLTDKAIDEEIQTISDLQKIKEVNPTKYELIIEQQKIKISTFFTELNLDLLKYIFPEFLWASFFIVTISHFEYCLIIISKYLIKQKKARISLSDIAGHSILSKFKILSSKILNLNYNFGVCKYWPKIELHQNVRNVIVHNGSVLNNSKQSKSVLNFCKNKKTTLQILNKNIVVNKNYIEEVISDLQSWFEDFLDKI